MTGEALPDQGLLNASKQENPDFIDFATEEQFAEYLNQMQAQQAGTSSDSQMGTFDGETWIPNQATTFSQAESSGNVQTQAPAQYSIKAGVCLHHIYYSSQLPWSGTELDFDRRYCDECLDRQRLVQGVADIDLGADLERQRLAQSIAEIDLNAELGVFNAASLVGSTAEVAFEGLFGQGSTATEEVGDIPAPLSFEALNSLMGFTSPVPLMGYTDHSSSTGPLNQTYPSLLDPAQQMIPSQESDLGDEQFGITLAAERYEPETQVTWLECQWTQSEDSEDMAYENVEYEDEDMEDAYDEPPSPEIGVSFSPEHIWPGEDIASEEPGYSSDYRRLDD